MENTNVYNYILSEEVSWKTTRVPITNSKDWNMSEHIERCIAVAGGFFHSGKNDGMRPYNDIVTPVIDYAFRAEGFNVTDIVPYVDDIDQSYKSYLIKKFHPRWAKKNQLDSFIDEVVESSIIFDLVLIKDVNSVKPENVKLQDIAFCDQTDIMSGPICIKHNSTITELLEYKGKWIDEKIDEVIVMSKASKKIKNANDRVVKTPGKNIEWYELYGTFPESWLYDNGDPEKYVSQMHIINFYTSSDGNKHGITLYKGKSRKLSDKFKSLKIDTVRSAGRACGRSLVERMFEPQVWHNYSGIKLKKMLDSAVNLVQTDSEEYGNKKLSELKENTVIKHEPGRPLTRLDMGIQNSAIIENQQIKTENQARILGSATEASLGKNPVSGTPFSLQNLIVQEGEGIHIYRKGKISTFFSDVLYPDLMLKYLVDDMNKGQKFSEDLSLDEIEEISNQIAINKANKKMLDAIFDEGKQFNKEQQLEMIDSIKIDFKKKGNKGFFEILKDETKDIPIKVGVNIVGKQKDMAKHVDSLVNIIREISRNPAIFQQVPGISKIYNQILESSGLSPIDFSKIVNVEPEIKSKPSLIKPEEALPELKTLV